MGEYAIPSISAAPHPVDGPPGIGKTQIMEQAASVSVAWHWWPAPSPTTRQSRACSLHPAAPSHGDKDVSVTEYTHELIDHFSVYAKMEATGLKEGILFIDEINRGFRDAGLTMLHLAVQDLRHQAVPAGWVIVAAGNPPEYNKSVRDLDIVTLDRVRRMDIEPDPAGMKRLRPHSPRSTVPS